MKCPKCNYVSHDYLDACRKCGIDLVTFKQDIGLLILQPGVLDLSLVLGGAGADNLFESVAEEVSMHASDDEDFDISLDDYAEHPGVRRTPAGIPRTGRPESETDLAGMDHLTLELDSSELPPAMTARLRAAQVIADEPPTVPTPPPAEPGALTLPGQVTLEMGPESIASEFPTAMLQHGMPSAPLPHQDASEPRATLDVPSLQLGVSHVDVVSRIPTDTPDVEHIDEAGDESVDAAVSVGDSGNLVSFPLQDVVLAEDAPMASVESTPEAIESTLPTILSMAADEPSGSARADVMESSIPTLDEASLPCADEVVPLLPPVIEEMPAAAETPPEGLLTSSDVFALEHLEASMLPEHLTLELESPVLSTDLASSLLPEATSMSLPASSDISEMPTSAGPELGLPVVEALPVEDPDAIALPGHLTLEFDGSAIASEVSSIILDNLQLDNPPGNTQSNISPRDDQVDDEEELLLDLDSLELDDDAPA
jgi:hypothetical protein